MQPFGDANWETALRLLAIPYRRRSTGVLVALCQFHKERTPSMHLWAKSGRYHCHGCHADGTIEEFVEKFGLTVERLYRTFNDPGQLEFSLRPAGEPQTCNGSECRSKLIGY